MNENSKIQEQDRLLFERIARDYAKKDRVASSAIPRKYQLLFAIRPILEKIGKNKAILEIGCGIGAPAKHLRGQYEKYIGTDYSEEMVKAAKFFNKSNNGASFFVDDIADSQLPDQIADIILAVGVLHHIVNIKKVMQSIIRLGKPGGYFVAIEPQRGNPLIQLMRWIRGRVDNSYSPNQSFFSYEELYNLMNDNELKEIEIVNQGFFSKPFAQVVLPCQPITALISKLAVATDKILDKHFPKIFRFLSWDFVVRARFLW